RFRLLQRGDRAPQGRRHRGETGSFGAVPAPSLPGRRTPRLNCTRTAQERSGSIFASAAFSSTCAGQETWIENTLLAFLAVLLEDPGDGGLDGLADHVLRVRI